MKKHPYPFILDHKPGFFLSWFFYRLFKRVHLNRDMIEELRRLHRKGTVVYAIKYRGHLDYLLYHYRFRMERLPYPKIAFDLNMAMFLPLSRLARVIRFYAVSFLKKGRLPTPFASGLLADAVERRIPSLLFLVNPKSFRRHYIHAEKDHLHALLEIQKDRESPIYLVPQLVLYKTTPEKDYHTLSDIFFGFKDRPGTVRKIGLFFRYHRRAFIDFGKPLDLKAYLASRPPGDSLEDLTARVRQLLIDRIDAQKRIILGPVMKSRQQIRESVPKDPEIVRVVEKTAGGDRRRLKQLRKKAGAYFDEIAADYNDAYIQMFNKGLTWLWKKMFQGIDVDPGELAVIREQARKGPLIYIPSHKSHIDYLVLNHVLYQHHMHIPRIAAGRNLAFWPMGHIFRKSGAFFIRRTFKGARLYARVFERYVKALLEEKHPLEFFIEGGRSRSGKLILPKIGFLSILLKGFHEGFCEDLVFVPASISYDRILEEKSYLRELGGAEKKKENFFQVLKARQFLKRRYGKIYIRFARPISVREYLSRNPAAADDIHRPLAFELIRAINRVTLVTPLSLIASAILTRHRRGFHLSELIATAGTLLAFLEKRGVPRATTLESLEESMEETLALLVNWKVAGSLKDVNGSETFYFVDEDKKPELEYYKNSIIHCFIRHAFVAVSLLTGTEETKSRERIMDDFRFLKRLFAYEFIFEEDAADNDAELDRLMEDFRDGSLVEEAGGGAWRLTRLGFEQLPLWAGFARTFLESYWIAGRALALREKTARGTPALLKNMGYLGLRYHKLGLIGHREAVSQITFRNALRFWNEEIRAMKTSRKEDGPIRDHLSRMGRRLYDMAHCGSY